MIKNDQNNFPKHMTRFNVVYRRTVVKNKNS